MTDEQDKSAGRSDDMSEYLQTFLDETDEQLDDLVETMLALEQSSTDPDDLNEAFRLIHSIKGSAGMMGYDNIIVLTHHLESRFERFRSGTERIDEATISLVLRCIDFLRQCSEQLRAGQPMSSSANLLGELKRQQEQQAAGEARESPPGDGEELVSAEEEEDPAQDLVLEDFDASDELVRLVVKFKAGLQLADLKAQLVVARLSRLGDVRSTQPDVEQLSEVDLLEQIEVAIETEASIDRLRAAADVEGVESIEFRGASAPSADSDDVTADELTEQARPEPPQQSPRPVQQGEAVAPAAPRAVAAQAPADETPESETDITLEPPEQHSDSPSTVIQPPPAALDPSSAEEPTVKVAETMRVDIDRLDNLMNLAGELVVNRARFVQISDQISPSLLKSTMVNRMRELRESLLRTIGSLENGSADGGNHALQIQQLQASLDLIDEQSEIWENGRLCFGQISEAIDQLSRVSQSLQQGVLDTRMVPVGPLFNRFRRVVRDLSKDRGKQVNLIIRGQNTELDKRMIDELGDPLIHLVRNSIDHGLESPDVRAGYGKPEVGTIRLEASHGGNTVYIQVRDDGGGINLDKIKAKLVDKNLLSESAVAELTDQQTLEYIWDPGFSTAQEVTDVSGRGVGMDVVKTRIGLLNGTIEVDSVPQQGTTFTLRLPLTLAIIDSLLVRMREVVFSIPIDDVREIVAVKESDIITVEGKQTFEVRGEFLAVVSIDEVFCWRNVDDSASRSTSNLRDTSVDDNVHVVILHTAGRTVGLRVDELLGSEDIVIKSLSDNFMNLPGLSGASVLGDGSVCLMLDIGTVMDMVTRPNRTLKI